jgi:protease-4
MKVSAYSQQILDSLLQGATLTAADAVAKQLVTEALSEHELRNRWKQDKLSEAVKKRYRGHFGSGMRIAVLVFEGSIVDGSNREDALMGQCIGDDFMVKQIRKLRENKRIKGVVFRINSGGGSATASESIQRELRFLSAEKPLVVSIGPMAASGGYWISTPGQRVFAQATSVTGSIGVIMLHMNIRKPLQNLGLGSETVKQGEFADFGSALRSLSPTERDVLEQMVDYYYQEFLKLVGNARSMSPEQVHAYAEGRLWTGTDALKRGLVDEIGGLEEALTHLRRALKAETSRITFHPVVKQPWLARMINSNMEKDAVAASSAQAILKSCCMVQGRPLLIEPFCLGARYTTLLRD